MTKSSPNSRGSLAFLAFINGIMGFVVSTAAVPTQSTALAASGLNLLRDSMAAWLALWISLGAFRRPDIVARVVGAIMVVLGIGVVAIAVGRLAYGSFPEPMSIAGLGALALLVNVVTIAVSRRQRARTAEARPREGFFKASVNEAAAHIAVVAAALIIAVTGSNVPDLAVGAAISGMFVLKGFSAVIATPA